jgi:DNA ligase-1
LDLGIGGSAISKALKKVCGLDSAGLKSIYNKHGDAGDVAYEAKRRQAFMLRKPKPLTIRGVYDILLKIANSKGQGSQEFKQGLVERLIQGARGPEESRYIVRTLVQHLRIGAVRTTMLIALSRAFLLSMHPEASYERLSISDLKAMKKVELISVYQRAEELVKTSFARHPNYADLVPALLTAGVGEELLLRCGLTLHIPLRPMLGSITRDLTEMLVRLQGRQFSCEYKYDGQRAQVHRDETGKVTIFSRHLENMTEKYPDVVDMVRKICDDDVTSFILEGEVVAVDKSNGELKPFQTLSNRAKRDVVITSITVDVCLFAFDLMFLNGEPLLQRTLRERRSLLRSLFVEIPHRFTWVKSMDADSNDHDKIAEFFKSATQAKCEGIMVKVLDNDATEVQQNTVDPGTTQSQDTPSKPKLSKTQAPKPSRRKGVLSTYEPDKRLESWLKVKKDYHASADTIDLVPIGGWHGQGRKSAWWSPILLAARDPQSARLVAVTKCMSGFSDAFYRANRAKYDPDGGENARDTRPPFVEYAGEPDVWFEPQEVWEIAFADVTLSPTYAAAVGLVSDERGLSLRFPRFLRVRDDKSVEEASTEEFLADLWWKQAKEPERDGGEDEGVGSGDG